MSELLREDLQWALRRTPREVVAQLKEQAGRLVVAGGFVRACVAGEAVNDIDLFAPNKDAVQAAVYGIENKLRKHDLEPKVYETDNAFTIKGAYTPIQVIHRWTYETPEQLMASFDFTVAMAGFWSCAAGESTYGSSSVWNSVCDSRFYNDLAAKRLHYTAPQRNEDAGGSLLRVLKFYQRGYRIPLDSMGAVVARLIKDVRYYQQPEEDVAKVITGLLREVDPSVDPEHLAHLPSTIEEDVPSAQS